MHLHLKKTCTSCVFQSDVKDRYRFSPLYRRHSKTSTAAHVGARVTTAMRRFVGRLRCPSAAPRFPAPVAELAGRTATDAGTHDANSGGPRPSPQGQSGPGSPWPRNSSKLPGGSTGRPCPQSTFPNRSVFVNLIISVSNIKAY